MTMLFLVMGIVIKGKNSCSFKKKGDGCLFYFTYLSNKLIQMKKLLLIFSCIALLSCDRVKKISYIYHHTHHYKNESGYDIRINSFKNGEQHIHHIQQNATKTEYFDSENNSNINLNALITHSDSIKVIFNEEKMKEWKISDNSSNRNPLRGENMILLNQSKLNYEYQFTFTPQDYDDALPCNGNCD